MKAITFRVRIAFLVAGVLAFAVPPARAQITPSEEERLQILTEPESIAKKAAKDKNQAPFEFFRSQVAPFDVRIGVLNQVEADVIASPFIYQRSQTGSATDYTRGFGDMQLRAVINLWGDDAGVTATEDCRPLRQRFGLNATTWAAVNTQPGATKKPVPSSVPSGSLPDPRAMSSYSPGRSVFK